MRAALVRSATPIIVAVLVGSVGCGGARASTPARSDRTTITQEQILEHHFTNAYEAVEALHSNWLVSKVTDSFTSPSQIKVYVDNTFFGGTESLRTINPNNVRTIRYFDGVQATARWGMDHSQGVILVTTLR